MVRIQSSWFPLYDRNPQRFVQSIFWEGVATCRDADEWAEQEAARMSAHDVAIA